MTPVIPTWIFYAIELLVGVGTVLFTGAVLGLIAAGVLFILNSRQNYTQVYIMRQKVQ